MHEPYHVPLRYAVRGTRPAALALCHVHAHALRAHETVQSNLAQQSLKPHCYTLLFTKKEMEGIEQEGYQLLHLIWCSLLTLNLHHLEMSLTQVEFSSFIRELR